jgi:hypothetical protein
MGLRLRDGCGHPARLQAERVALRKGMIDLRLAELREGRLTIASQGRAPTAYSATQRPA